MKNIDDIDFSIQFEKEKEFFLDFYKKFAKKNTFQIISAEPISFDDIDPHFFDYQKTQMIDDLLDEIGFYENQIEYDKESMNDKLTIGIFAHIFAFDVNYIDDRFNGRSIDKLIEMKNYLNADLFMNLMNKTFEYASNKIESKRQKNKFFLPPTEIIKKTYLNVKETIENDGF